MRDASSSTDNSIQVRNNKDGSPYLIIASIQVPQVCVLLDSVGLKYTVEGYEDTTDEQQSLSSIVFQSGASVEEIQGLLDGLD